MLVTMSGCDKPTDETEAPAPRNQRNGRLVHLDGTPAARTPLIVRGSRSELTSCTDDQGGYAVEADELPATLLAAEALWLAPAADTTATTTSIEIAAGQQTAIDPADVFVVGPTRMVAALRPGEPMPAPVSQAVSRLDVIAAADDNGWMLAIVRPPEVTALRLLGVEIVIIDTDSNAYAARIRSTTPEAAASDLRRRIEQGRRRLSPCSQRATPKG
jgi:hypothetical protein